MSPSWMPFFRWGNFRWGESMIKSDVIYYRSFYFRLYKTTVTCPLLVLFMNYHLSLIHIRVQKNKTKRKNIIPYLLQHKRRIIFPLTNTLDLNFTFWPCRCNWGPRLFENDDTTFNFGQVTFKVNFITVKYFIYHH